MRLRMPNRSKLNCPQVEHAVECRAQCMAEHACPASQLKALYPEHAVSPPGSMADSAIAQGSSCCPLPGQSSSCAGYFHLEERGQRLREANERLLQQGSTLVDFLFASQDLQGLRGGDDCQRRPSGVVDVHRTLDFLRERGFVGLRDGPLSQQLFGCCNGLEHVRDIVVDEVMPWMVEQVPRAQLLVTVLVIAEVRILRQGCVNLTGEFAHALHQRPEEQIFDPYSNVLGIPHKCLNVTPCRDQATPCREVFPCEHNRVG